MLLPKTFGEFNRQTAKALSIGVFSRNLLNFPD